MKTAIVQFRIGYVDENHLADVIGKIQQFMWVSDGRIVKRLEKRSHRES